MSKCVTINLTIPISDEEWAGPSITFYQWIPGNPPDFIIFSNGLLTASIGIDKSCVSSLSTVTDDLIKRWANISVLEIKIEISLKEVDDDLVNFIYKERDAPREIHYDIKPSDDGYDALKEKYKSIGLEVAEFATDAVNRIISYARNEKGQYWLSEHKFNKNQLTSFNNRCNAKAKIDSGDWFRWCPPNVDSLTLTLRGDDAAINCNEWPHVSRFVKCKSRPNLAFELLANSRQLLDSGHMRSAIIEAVSALEVSVSKFAKNPNTENLHNTSHTHRIDVNRIGSQIDHLGLSGSIRYLIPLLLSEEVLPDRVLSKCYTALEIRNNIVHQGQRDVSHSLVDEILGATEAFCKILHAFTMPQVDRSKNT